MSRARHKKKTILRGSLIIFAVVFIVSAAFFFLGMWEKSHGTFLPQDENEEFLTYEGKTYVPKGGVESFLVLGLDKYEGVLPSEAYNNDLQADFLMLFVFDHSEKSFQALQISRDTMAKVNVLGVAGQTIGKETCQIALSHTYGNGKDVSSRNTADSVSELLFGVKVNHYLSLKLDAIPKLNDSVGGVELEILDDFTAIDANLIKGKTIRLKGEQAMTYVRTRFGLEDSSNTARMRRQRQYIEALYRTWQEKAKEEGFSESVLLEISEYLCSDRSANQLQDLAYKFEEYEFLGIETLSGEEKVGSEFMEFYPDQKALKQLVIALFYEEK